MGVLDFSDQLVLATRIVREAPAVRAALREEFRAVLLDEFQDTSVIQMELLSTLFGDHAVTAVGDPNQAIYGWRGASASSLETFLERFQTGAPEEGQTLTLSTAWRNDVSILDAANRVAAPLREVASYQAGKEQLKAQSPVLVPRPGAGRGVVEIAYTPPTTRRAGGDGRLRAAGSLAAGHGRQAAHGRRPEQAPQGLPVDRRRSS